LPVFELLRRSTRRPDRRRYLSAVLAGALLAGCAGSAPQVPDFYRMEDFARVPKFDAHVHINATAPRVLEQARADGFELLSINVDYPDFPPLAQQAAVAREMASLDPRHFHYAASFTLDGWGAPGWAAEVNSRIDQSVAQGALAVKVWKNIGMSLRNSSGQLVMIDDPAFDPVFQHLQAIGLPLIGHQGEPHNCWLPLEQMTTANDRSYFREHPQYHMYLQPTMPGYEEQMAARDRMLARQPGLRFVGAHLASLEWNVDRLGAFLDAHPDAVVDLAARMPQVQYQSHREHAKVREFFIRYQDRILYGSDLTLNPDTDPAEFNVEAHQTWLSHWTYLATNAVQHIDDIDADVAGLQLPRTVIDRIYQRNAQRAFLGANAAAP